MSRRNRVPRFDDAKTAKEPEQLHRGSVVPERIDLHGSFLAAAGIRYVYDARYRIAANAEVRPDFYLPEFDLYIEYWGMETEDYVARRREKQVLYQRAGKKLISLTPADLPDLEAHLKDKLNQYRHNVV